MSLYPHLLNESDYELCLCDWEELGTEKLFSMYVSRVRQDTLYFDLDGLKRLRHQLDQMIEENDVQA